MRAGARFLRCAVPRTAPVEMTRGGALRAATRDEQERNPHPEQPPQGAYRGTARLPPTRRHFDRSAGGAEWRNLVRAGARFLRCAVLRTAPVEMTRGAPFGRLLGMRKKESSSRAAPAGGVSRDGPPFPPRRHFDRSAGGAEWRNLVRAGARFLRCAVPRTAPVEMTRGRIEGRRATPHPSCPAPGTSPGVFRRGGVADPRRPIARQVVHICPLRYAASRPIGVKVWWGEKTVLIPSGRAGAESRDATAT